MELRDCFSVEAAAELAAEMVEETVRANPRAALLPATGNTPVPLYRTLAVRGLSLPDVRIFQLDEYVGVPGDDPRSLYGWLRRILIDPLQVAPSRVTRLRGDARDLQAECASYDRAVTAAGGIDLAILGLGLNGHLGYNEPPSPPDAPTRVVPLSAESRVSAASYWPPGTVTPDRGITAGMDVILSARRVLLLVTGSEKRHILRRVLEGPMEPGVPASFLRAVHGATVIADRDALAA